MADKDELIQQFIGVTQTDPDRARFYLESSAWNLEVAMSSFWDSNCDGPEPEVSDPPAGQAPSASDISMPTVPSRNPDASRVTTFSSMSVDSASSDEEGQAYYAGGSDTSGQQVLGPPKKKDADKLVNKLFKSARDHGAEEKSDEASASKSSKKSSFVGAGYRLGETNDDTTVVPGASKPPSQQQVDKKLKLWKNGFSVGDGELRDYNDPNNKQFLNSISKGEIPQELIREARGGEVNLDMEDHRAEDFIRPKVKVKAFSGAGHMLGSPAPNMTGSSSAGDTSSTPGGGGSTISVDQSKPVTSVQLRLADGTRQVLKLNHSHTVQDVRQHIISSNPQYAQSNFCLMTTFPNKELTEESQTLEEAKLLNAVIVQRVK